MEQYIELLRECGKAILYMMVNPFYWAAIVFILLQYRQHIVLERKLFHVRTYSLLDRMLKTAGWGWLAGIVVSIIIAIIGLPLSSTSMLTIWAISLLLILFRIRFFCLAYSIGIIGILHTLVALFPQVATMKGIGIIARPVLEAHVPSLLILVAILHLAEAIFLRLQKASTASPLLYESKRGRVVGGYQLQQFWPVPLFLFVPFVSGGWTLMTLPVVIGFTAMTMTRLPLNKARNDSKRLFIYSGIMLALATASWLWSPLTIIASVLCIVLHEAVIWYSRQEELKGSPIFVNDSRGMKLLATLPGSIASEMGLRTGEIVHKVNGLQVLNEEELHRAIQINPAFCKLEVIDLEGERRFLQRAVYAGEHHQLGMLLSPDEGESLSHNDHKPHLFSYLKNTTRSLQNLQENNKTQRL